MTSAWNEGDRTPNFVMPALAALSNLVTTARVARPNFVMPEQAAHPNLVMPAKAGIQGCGEEALDTRLRGCDGRVLAGDAIPASAAAVDDA